MKIHKKHSLLIAIVSILFISNVAIFLFGFSVLSNTPQKIKSQPETLRAPTFQTSQATENISVLSLEGFVKADIDLRPTALIVKNGCKGIPMTPTEQQIRSIASILNNQTDFRPSTHDLMEEIFDTYGIQVLQSKIIGVEEEDEIYYARIVVKKDDKILNMDTKPSDAIAVALRAGIPFYIKQEILDMRGQDICSRVI